MSAPDLDFSLLFGDVQPAEQAAELTAPKPFYAELKAEREAPTIANYNRNVKQDESNKIVVEKYWRGIAEAYTVKADILKGLAAGIHPLKLLIRAAEAVTLLTDDIYFYDQVLADIQRIHGAGLLDPAALDVERDNIKYRLERLKASAEREREAIDENAATDKPEDTPAANLEAVENLRRINHAIKAHNKRLAEITALMDTPPTT